THPKYPNILKLTRLNQSINQTRPSSLNQPDYHQPNNKYIYTIYLFIYSIY
ncbi:hypothetical protein SAMD00019534_068710, partial [Acytostelium subglobosum LB1]|uniref:hypothetical protein n=1 Tax=Acytostelium subglobosum LB1 TaxID=1410327 RepID=UPI000644D535